MSQQLDPGHIMQTATAFWASKVLLTAVEFDLFSTLGDGSMTASQLGDALEIHPRGRYDFFDALVALRFLERNGDGPEGRYLNSPETAAFLDRSSPSYIGGLPEMLNARLFGFWNHLGEALKTGQPQNEVKESGKPMFEELYSDEARLGTFLAAMTGFQAGKFSRTRRSVRFLERPNCDRRGRGIGSAVPNPRRPASAFEVCFLRPSPGRAACSNPRRWGRHVGSHHGRQWRFPRR